MSRLTSPSRHSLSPKLPQDVLLHGFTPSTVFHGELQIAALDAFSRLLHLLPPSVLFSACMNRDNLGQHRVHPSATAVQIHYIPGHYLVSYQHQGTITLYDSLPHYQRVQQLMPQLKVLYLLLSNGQPPIRYVVSQLQGFSPDCGLFAAANACHLLSGYNPQSSTFAQHKMRQHIYHCLTTGVVTPFPTCGISSASNEDLMDRYFTTSLQNQATWGATKEAEQNENRGLYMQKEDQGPVYRQKEAKARDTNTACLKNTDTARLKNKLHMREKRKDPQYRQKVRRSAKLCKQKARQDPQYRQKEAKASDTDTARLKDKERKQKARQDPQYRQKEAKARDSDAARLKHKLRMREKRKDPQYRQKERQTDKERKQEARQDPQYRQREAKASDTDTARFKNKERKLKARQDPQYRQNEANTARLKNKLRMREKRKDLQYRQKEAQADKERKQEARQDPQYRQREACRKNTERKQKARQDPHYKQKEANTARLRMREKRKDPQYRQREVQAAKLCRQKARQDPQYRQKKAKARNADVRLKDKERKQKARQDPLYRQKERQADSERKRKKYLALLKDKLDM